MSVSLTNWVILLYDGTKSTFQTSEFTLAEIDSAQNKHPIFSESLAILRLALPVIGSQLALTAMNVTDVIMAGRLSAEDLAAIAVGNSLVFPV